MAAVMKQLITPSVVTEVTLTCSDGLQLAAQSWRNNTHTATPTQRILCLHGWMDNCRSFHLVAPRILQKLPDAQLVALDFPGHGRSHHLAHPPALLSESAFYVAEAVRQLQWDKFTLIGHSMGAAVSCLYAAAFPEQVERLVLLEGGGPLARPVKDVAKHVRQHVERRQLGITKPPRVYPDMQKAVKTRCQTARNFPGNQYLSEAAAAELVQRGTIAAADGSGLSFCHDPRLQWPSIQYFSDEQVEAVYQDIQCPTALLLSVDGWPFDKDRLRRVLDLLKPVVHETLPGSHHFHADPETADNVTDHVLAFVN